MYLVRVPYCPNCQGKESATVMFSQTPTKASYGKSYCPVCGDEMAGTDGGSKQLPDVAPIFELVREHVMRVEDFGFFDVQFGPGHRVPEDEDWVRLSFKGRADWKVSFRWDGVTKECVALPNPDLDNVPHGIYQTAEKMVSIGFVITQVNSRSKGDRWLYMERLLPEGILPEGCRRLRMEIRWDGKA